MAYMKKRSAEAMGLWPFDVLFPPAQPAAPAAPAPAPAPASPTPMVCTPPQVYEPFYDSCVNPCPKGQAYDHNDGICKDQMSNTTMLAIGVGAVAAYVFLFGKKRRRRR